MSVTHILEKSKTVTVMKANCQNWQIEELWERKKSKKFNLCNRQLFSFLFSINLRNKVRSVHLENLLKGELFIMLSKKPNICVIFIYNPIYFCSF